MNVHSHQKKNKKKPSYSIIMGGVRLKHWWRRCTKFLTELWDSGKRSIAENSLECKIELMRIVFMHLVYLRWVDENGFHALGIFELSWWEWFSRARYIYIELVRMVFMCLVYLNWVDENGFHTISIFALSWWEWFSCTRYICIILMIIFQNSFSKI